MIDPNDIELCIEVCIEQESNQLSTPAGNSTEVTTNFPGGLGLIPGGRVQLIALLFGTDLNTQINVIGIGPTPLFVGIVRVLR